MRLLTVVAFVLGTAVIQSFGEDRVEEALLDSEEEFDTGEMRDGRLFPFVAYVKFGEDVCSASSNGVTNTGVCRTQKQCDEQDGNTLSGSTCGNGYGVCCSFQLACPSSNTMGTDITVKSSGTHIVNAVSGTPAPCQINFRRPNKDICQVRLDFVKFKMQPPNAWGHCDQDSFTVIADNLDNFIACGVNDGEHLYLHYGQSDLVTASISPSTDTPPTFDIQATYIKCTNSTEKGKRKGKKFTGGGKKKNSNNEETHTLRFEPAPLGCDQYYTTTSGIVKSFNYQSDYKYVQNQINTEQYMVCIKTPPGSNKIQWQPCPGEKYPFYISGGVLPNNDSLVGSDCQTDYIDIPGSPSGRYCGASFPSNVISPARPFVMWVNFDGQEIPGVNNMIDPLIGCPVGYVCVNSLGSVVTPEGPNNPGEVLPCKSEEAVNNGQYCRLAEGLWEFVDFSNNGFCLKYTVM